ncbi:MAG: triose-phosphate isomerase [Bacteriovoracia bacterium]
MNKTRGLIIAGNWKMNHGPRATADFFTQLKTGWAKLPAAAAQALQAGSVHARIFTPAVSLTAARESAAGTPITIGAQNAHGEKDGAFTGELSAGLLQEVGIGSTLVGHSERRQFFGETDATARARAEGLLAQGMEVMFCIGETRVEREGGQTKAVLERQIDQGMTAAMFSAGAGAHGFPRFTLAYEPVWAIGTGLNATPEQAEEAHQMIRKHLWTRFGVENASRTPILYGGSVKPDNVASLLDGSNVDGALVGGASLKADSYLALLAACGKYAYA